MGTQINAIETKYKGYRFRSRLEVRWAVFFDALGIKWEYELEGFDLGNAGYYLPDFYIPSWDMYLEIKPVLPLDYFSDSGMLIWDNKGYANSNPLMKAMAMNVSTVKDNTAKEYCAVVCGSPWVPTIKLYTDGKWELVDGSLIVVPMPYDMVGVQAFGYRGNDFGIYPLYVAEIKDKEQWKNYIPPTVLTIPENKEVPNPGFSADNLYVQLQLPHDVRFTPYFGNRTTTYENHKLLDAYQKARSARFEHGEHG